MSEFVCLSLVAIPLVKKKMLNIEDREVPGLYRVFVSKDLWLDLAASVVLDAFHSTYAVHVLDDFVFYVFQPETGLVLSENEDYASYSNSDTGVAIEQVGEKLPRIYAVTGESLPTKNLMVVADNQMAARLRANVIMGYAQKDFALTRLY